MRTIINRPQLFFIALIPLLIILGSIYKEETFEIAVFGGGISIDFWTLSLISCVYFMLISFNYLALKWAQKKPKKSLTILHIILQIIALILFLYFIIQFNNPEEPTSTLQLNYLFFISFICFFISVIIHFINFLSSLFLKRQ